jgi:hypothetical protein
MKVDWGSAVDDSYIDQLCIILKKIRSHFLFQLYSPYALTFSGWPQVFCSLCFYKCCFAFALFLNIAMKSIA